MKIMKIHGTYKNIPITMNEYGSIYSNFNIKMDKPIMNYYL